MVVTLTLLVGKRFVYHGASAAVVIRRIVGMVQGTKGSSTYQGTKEGLSNIMRGREAVRQSTPNLTRAIG